jgi:hypothetical protein
MLRKHWTLVALTSLFVVTLVMAGILARQERAVSAAPQRAPELAPEAMPNEQTAIGSYMWSFAAKFVCGYQPPTPAGTNPQGETVVKPGNYATDISIHNYNYRVTPLKKKFILLVQGDQLLAAEPQTVEPRKIMTMTLGADLATMDDCNNLWNIMFGTPPAGQMPLMIGYLVILSPLDLDIDVTYTAEVPGALSASGTGISEDAERVTGKRVFLPNGILP